MSKPPTPDQIIDAARLATESYFAGENKAKRSPRNDMEQLRALVRDWDVAQAKEDTTRITKDKPHG
jgi:hypothetical protein